MLKAPAMDLVVTAREIGKLDELANTLLGIEPKTDRERRDRLALIAMVRAAQGKDDEAKKALMDLMPMLKAITADVPILDRWAEYVAATFVLDQTRRSSSSSSCSPATALLAHIVEEQAQKGQNLGDSDRSSAPFVGSGQARGPSRPPGPSSARSRTVPSGSLSPEGPTRAELKGNRFRSGPSAMARPGISPATCTITCISASSRGDFEIEGELTSFNYREGRIGYGGQSVMVHWERKKYDLWQYDRFAGSGFIEPPMKEANDYYPFKISVKNGIASIFASGQKTIHEQRITADSDPWLTIYVRSFLTGGVKNLKITGHPTYPSRS